MRREQAFFLGLAFLASSTIIIAAAGHRSNSPSLELTTHRLSLGSSGIGNTGWLVPSDILITTSFTTNQSLSGYIVGTLNVFPYEIQTGTVLHLNLYLNGQLAASQKYELNGTYRFPAKVLANVGDRLATFSNSLLGFTVSKFPLAADFPAGASIMMTVWTSSPIWVQIDGGSLIHSYQQSGYSSYSSPPELSSRMGSIAPYTLSVELESRAK